MRIPRDLKPGDKLWYSKTNYAVVSDTLWAMWHYGTSAIHATDGCRAMRYREIDGHEVYRDTPPIIRIERVSSKTGKPKMDKDAKWLIREYVDPLESNAAYRGPKARLYMRQAKRLRAIARRLNGGKV